MVLRDCYITRVMKMMRVRTEDEDFERWKRLAGGARLSLSAWVRVVLNREADKVVESAEKVGK